MTTTPIPTAAPAATPVTGARGTTTTGGRADGAADPFTSLLAAALGDGMSQSVVQALAELADEAGSAEAAGEEITEEAVTEAVAAVAGAAHPLQAALTEWAARAASGTAGEDVGNPRGEAAVAASGDGMVAVEGAMGTGETPAAPTDGAPVTPATAAVPAAPAVPGTPTTAAAAASPAPPVPPVLEGAVTAQATAAVARPVAAEAKATGAVTADIDPATGSDPAPMPSTPSSSATTSATAASAAPAGTAATGDAGLHARIVARVVQAVEALENAPPPRRMTVEVPDSEGLRLQVAIRGGEVHVSVQASTGQPDLGAWGRELASTLAARGMTLGGFETGTDGHPGRRPDQPDADPDADADPSGPQDGRPRALRTDSGPARDGDLRL